LFSAKALITNEFLTIENVKRLLRTYLCEPEIFYKTRITLVSLFLGWSYLSVKTNHTGYDMNMKHTLACGTMLATMLGLTPLSYAESVKLVQWWDEYLPQKFESGASMGYSRKTISQQEQDVNGDGVYNDTLLCKEFSMTDFFNPPYGCLPESKKSYQYRTDRPSAPFYGGLVARYTNVSDITEDYRGEQIPVFRKTAQATVQPVENAKPYFYKAGLPHNISRGGNLAKDGLRWGLGWADITLAVLHPKKPLSIFEKNEDIEQNFTFVSIWKKEDFVNGGASAEAITFDQTSRISVDVARYSKVEECRFIVQDGSQLWISEYAYGVIGKPAATIELNPLESRWAIYTPLGCDMEFNKETADFVEHTFKDVQAMGVYFATHPFSRQPAMGIAFDNFQAYAATRKPSPESPIVHNPIGFAIDSKGESINTDATFSRGISVNGGTVTVSSSDQMDIRGVITVNSDHVGKEAEILVVVGYKPDSVEEESFFIFNKDGSILPWDGNIANLVAYQETDLFFRKDDKGKKIRFKQNIVLMPERRVQIFPVALSAFRDHELETVLLGCERPRTYSGILNGILPGFLRFFFGYRLREDGTIVYNRESINVMITSD
jgi:hypothetical protein